MMMMMALDVEVQHSQEKSNNGRESNIEIVVWVHIKIERVCSYIHYFV